MKMIEKSTKLDTSDQTNTKNKLKVVHFFFFRQKMLKDCIFPGGQSVVYHFIFWNFSLCAHSLADV